MYIHARALTADSNAWFCLLSKLPRNSTNCDYNENNEISGFLKQRITHEPKTVNPSVKLRNIRLSNIILYIGSRSSGNHRNRKQREQIRRITQRNIELPNCTWSRSWEHCQIVFVQNTCAKECLKKAFFCNTFVRSYQIRYVCQPCTFKVPKTSFTYY